MWYVTVVIDIAYSPLDTLVLHRFLVLQRILDHSVLVIRAQERRLASLCTSLGALSTGSVCGLQIFEQKTCAFVGNRIH